ncbi:MAG: chalcone isomerase family protein [Gammaproteobacteria bacterium]|nr:chalcone isomerase family protein [Gammaproteobacteria bacterium]
MIKKVSILFSALLLMPIAASAAELAGVTAEDKVTVGDQELVLNGMGLREKGWFDVYVGAYYVTTKSSNAIDVVTDAGQSRMVLTFVRDVGGEKITGAWKDGFASNNTAETKKAIKDRIDLFNSFFGDIEDGQSMIFDFLPGKGVTVTIAGEEKGTVEGDDFAMALKLVFFGKNPPDDDLKEGMLGLD